MLNRNICRLAVLVSAVVVVALVVFGIQSFTRTPEVLPQPEPTAAVVDATNTESSNAPDNLEESVSAELQSGELTVTFIDVGQGDSALVEAPNGVKLLIDGGDYGAYNNQLADFLWGRGISAVDFALVSHYHSDHMGGIMQLLKRNSVKTLIIPNYDDKKQNREKLTDLAHSKGVGIVEVSQGDNLDLGDKNLKIEVLHPRQGGFDLYNENDNSLVLKLTYFKSVFLFVGDLEDDAEQTLLGKYDLEADVLKVGHHGSSSSTSPAFLNAVDPTYAVIEAGADNRYGHPHYEVLDALQNDDVLVFRTDTDGDVTFKASAKGIFKISTQRGTESYGN